MDIPKEEVKGIKFEHTNQDFYPENLQNSKLLPYINENLQFKISDFSLVYHKSEEESINMLKIHNFLKISDDSVIYDEKQINCVFICDESILSDNLLNEIKNINDVNYNRIYKKNNHKWIFVPELEKKDNFMKFIQEKDIKMFNLKKSNIINSIIYYKESYDLKDRRKNSDYSNVSNNKWKKYSKNGYIPHKSSYNSNFYNNNYHRGYKGRERFNSDGINSKNNNNNNYYYNNNHTNNNYNRAGQIEIEIGEIKYPLSIKYKYSNNFLNNIFLKLKNENVFDTKPKYLVEDNEIISNKPKNMENIKFTSSPTKSEKAQAFENRNIDGENKTNLKIKIPKINPLSQIKRAYNKFDAFPQNTIVIK